MIYSDKLLLLFYYNIYFGFIRVKCICIFNEWLLERGWLCIKKVKSSGVFFEE